VSHVAAMLVQRLEQDASRLAYTFTADEGREKATYGDLARRVLAIAQHLRPHARPGDRAMLLLSPGLDYVAAFLACAVVRVIAVPAYPVRGNRRTDRTFAVMRSARPALALHDDEAAAQRLSQRDGSVPHLHLRGMAHWDGNDPAAALHAMAAGTQAGDTAFLQYTSGSTGDPKGVMVTHANLLHNSAQMQAKFATSRGSRMVSWLPPYHDMGLILGILHPLFIGFESHLMPPAEFIQRPLAWLEAVGEHRATISGGPDFAYEACVRAALAAPPAGLDLSAWEVAFNGAETIHARTLRRFAQAFAASGLRRHAAYPCYGLAENTLMASGLCDRAERERAAAEPAQPGGFVNCGTGIPDQALAIVDPHTLHERGEGETGEIWLAGPSVAAGYWGHDEATRLAFGHRLATRPPHLAFLRTGDLGFVRAGALHVCGRLKDLIVVRGIKHYPQDIESHVEESHPALRRGGYCAAFASPGDDGETIGVAVELSRLARKTDEDALTRSIRACVAVEFGLRVKEVLVLQPGQFPKTSSGKIPRAALRRMAADAARPAPQPSPILAT
jgi:acyl-CoA synthetase (AMP-forming)/AMP-acid ligase II